LYLARGTPLKKPTNAISRGKILADEVKKTGLKITELVKRVGYQYSTYFSHVNNPNLSLEILAKYGKAIGHDFSKEIPEMVPFVTADPQPNAYEEMSREALIRELHKQKDRLLDQAEKIAALLEENKRLLEERTKSG
jgi:hypothetical protein